MMRCPLDWEIYRRPYYGDLGDRHNGFLVLPKRELIVIFSDGGGWEHVSVSCKGRCPTWAEMDEVKGRFWEETDTVIQVHPPVAEHVNEHPFCLHLWRPIGVDLPRPPMFLVGTQKETRRA